MTVNTLDPRSRRVRFLIPGVLAMLSMIGPFSIDTPFPAFAQMQRDFGVGSTEMQLVVTAYLAAFAVMSIFHGPLSDAIGRRPVILASISVYVLASVGAALAPSLAVLLAFRVLQGLSAGILQALEQDLPGLPAQLPCRHVHRGQGRRQKAG